MENAKQAIATFYGQVKSCRGDRQSQWKSGCVKISHLEDGGLCALMFLNVMPSQVYSQINVPHSGVSVKSNRVVIEDAKGPCMYVRLAGSREVEESRRAICRMATYEAPKRSKAEVGIHAGLKSTKSPLPTVMKQSTPAVSWTKIATPKSDTQSGDCNSSNANSNGWQSVNRLKRQSLDMEDGDIDKLYNDENQEKTPEYTRFRKMSPGSDNKEQVNLSNLKAKSFYGKSVLMSPGLHIKSPRSRIRDQAVSSVGKGLYSSMLSDQESRAKEDGDVCRDVVIVPPPPTKNAGTDTEEANSSIVGFENLGNTCFINSPLQCLAYLEPLSLDIQEVALKYGKQLKTGSIIRLLYFLMKDVRKTISDVNPERVKLILMRLRKVMDVKFAANTQQDAHELLSEILDRCDEEIKELLKLKEEEEGQTSCGVDNLLEMKQQQKEADGLSKSIPNPTTRNFNSYFKNNFQCQTCKNQTVSQEEHDTTMMLALTSHPELHLQDCVDNYFKGCEVEMKCEACKQNEKATITRKIVRRPRCLILNLLRYSTDNMDAKKKMDRVSIPRYISIGDFCSDDAKPPSHIAPAFLNDRNFGSASPEVIKSYRKPQPEQEEVRTDKGLSEAQIPSIPSDSTHATFDPSVVAADDHVVSTASDVVGIFDKTIDDDSVFGRSSTMNTADTWTADYSTSQSYESSSWDPLHGRNKKTDNAKYDIRERDSYNTNNGIDDRDDGVVTFKKISNLKQQNVTERVKCRGGSEKAPEFNGESVENGSLEEDLTVEVKTSCQELKVAVDENGIGVGIEGDDDFVPVGEVQGTVRIEENGAGKDDPKKSVAWASKVDVIGKPDLKVKSSTRDFGSCLKVRVDDPWEDDNNNMVAKDQEDNANAVEEEELMDAEDMGTQTILGRDVHDYSEDELASLNVEALTEYEVLLYVQALSRFEYVKETKGREKEQELLEQQMFETMSDDFVYDESFLEGAESMLKSASSFTTFDDSQSQTLELSTSPSKLARNGKIREPSKMEESSTASLDDAACSGRESLGESFGGTQKVPDIMESGEDAALLCYENLSEDDDIGNLKGLKVSEESGALRGNKKKRVMSVTAGLENFSPPGTGVLSDKNQHRSSVSKKDLQDALELSKMLGTSHSGQQSGVVNNSPNSSSDSDKDTIPITINRQGQSPSYFPKPSTDLCIISPSKNRNLVKTRDYSRLRSPSASPKKKAAKSSPGSSFPLPSPGKKGSASKQLKFSEDLKSENVRGNCKTISLNASGRETLDNATPQKKASYINSITPDYSLDDKPVFIANEVKSKSRALIFGQDEPDSMKCNNDSNTTNLCSWSPLINSGSCRTSTVSTISSSVLVNSITTSTPIMSETAATSSCKTILSPDLPSSTSTTNLKNRSDAFSTSTSQDILICEEIVDAFNSGRASRERCGFGAIGEKVPKHGACTPVQDGSRRKINRSLASSFSAAEGKENSMEITSERQARRKRISQIEQGDADCSYRLVGIVNHHGESLFAGHYTCSSYNLYKQRWYRMDDKHTEETSEWSVRKDSSTTGYIFFYMDKDLFESYARERARGSSPPSQKSSTTPV